MGLTKFIHTENGRVLMSILLGLGLATAFQVVCTDVECMRFMSPSFNTLQAQVQKYAGKCFSYTPEQVSCKSINTTHTVHMAA